MEANEMIVEKEAMILAGCSRSALYNYRKCRLVRWKSNVKGRKVRYNVKDLKKLI